MSKIDVICDHSQRELTEVPIRVLEMTHLQMLYLEGNYLRSLPEDIFVRLSKLTWLDLRNNKLKAIPVGIAYHPYLEYLLLENNEIQSLPNELGLVPNLKVLQLAGNPLEYPAANIIEQGVDEVTSFLKDEYYKAHALEVPASEESLSSKESETTVVPVKREKISVRDLLRRSSDAAKLHPKHMPVIAIRSLSAEHQEELKRNDEKTLATSRSTYLRPSKKTHRVVKYCSKLNMHSHYNSNKYVNVRKARKNEDRVVDKELKEIWLNKLRELLVDQEKLLQQERNLKTLNSWRLDKKMESLKVRPSDTKLSVPYDTSPEYDRMLSRKDLAMEIDQVIRKCKNVPKNLDMQKLVSEVISQFKNMEVAKQEDMTPRSEVLNAEKDIQMIIDLQKRVTALQSKNDSY